MNKILRNRLFIVIFGFVVFTVALNFVLQRFIARDNFIESSRAIFSEVTHMLHTNDEVIANVKRNFKENCRLRARIAAALIENDRSIIESQAKLMELADLLKVDEVHIFDESGTIISGTIPTAYGMTVYDGEQIGFFKDMLHSKDVELVQDFAASTGQGRVMQYAAVWMPCKEHFVQIGRSPRWVMEVLKDTELPSIFEDIVLDVDAYIFAVDVTTDKIVASTKKVLENKDVSYFGVPSDLYKEASKGIKVTHNNEDYYLVISSDVLHGNLKLGKFIKTSSLYKDVNKDTVILIFYLGLAAIVVIGAISRYLKYYVIDDIESVNGDLKEITNGNLNTKINASATPELKNLGEHINTMVGYLKENTRRTFEMCDKLHMPIGLYEYRNGMKKVTINGNLAEILCLDGKKDHAVFANKELYEEKLEQIKRNLVDVEHGIYKLPWAERYIRFEETEYPDATIGVVMDVTAGYVEMSNIARERDTDELTGLTNRRGFFVKMEKLFQDTSNLGWGGMYFVDANKLKYVNDAIGHKAGDFYLCAIADALRAWAGKNKIYCRLGGDEFVLFVYGAASKEELLEAFEDAMYRMNETYVEYEGEKIRLSYTVGAAFYPEHGEDFRALMRMADKNMLENKGKGTTTRHMLN